MEASDHINISYSNRNITLLMMRPKSSGYDLLVNISSAIKLCRPSRYCWVTSNTLDGATNDNSETQSFEAKLLFVERAAAIVIKCSVLELGIRCGDAQEFYR